jgi:hypothetical protein
MPTPSHLDILRAIRAEANRLGPCAEIDTDLRREAGMDGNYQQLLQAARNLDAASPITESDNAVVAKALVQQVLEILPYVIAVLEGAKKDETARAVRECVVQLRTATRLLTVSA